MKAQFITDDNGTKLAVILPIKEYQKIMDDLEDLEDVRLYDQVKKSDSGERIPMEEAFKVIEAKRTENNA
jgi:hypothetical protein